jgi:hypothetical protein
MRERVLRDLDTLLSTCRTRLLERVGVVRIAALPSFAPGRHRIGCTSIAQPLRVGLLSRADQGARERGVKPTRDSGHPLVTKLSERSQWLVILEDAMTHIVLLKQHSSRGIERRREAVSRHKRGRDRIANIVWRALRAFPVIFEIESAATSWSSMPI